MLSFFDSNNLTQLVFNCTELILLLILLFKFAIFTRIKTLKGNAKNFRLNYWFYFGFILNGLIAASYNILTGELLSLGFSIELIKCTRLIHLTGSLNFLHVYLYKTIVEQNADNFCSAKVGYRKGQRNYKICVASMYCHSLAVSLLQAIAVGLTPKIMISETFSVEYYFAAVAMLTTTGIFITYKTSVTDKHYIKTWLTYSIFTALIIPYTHIINYFEPFFQLYEKSSMYLAALKTPYIIFKGVQISILALMIFNKYDLRSVYNDRIC